MLGQVVMRIIKHCRSSTGLAAGQLLGFYNNEKQELELTYSFQTPPAGEAEGEDGGEDGDYQVSMLRCLREVNVDCNNVGWYTSSFFFSFVSTATALSQYEYQSNVEGAVALVYDPRQTASGSLFLKAFRLTERFMNFAGQVFGKAGDRKPSSHDSPSLDECARRAHPLLFCCVGL